MFIDSNARSKICHDTTTNSGKMMDDFIASNQLYIINEDSSRIHQSTREKAT